MSRRIEIELTSQRSETEWTWRAAGAKQPKGVLDGSVLYKGAKVGDVTKAEADFEIEGITITQVYTPQGKRAEPANRIEIIGPSRKFEGVTSQLVAKGDRPRGKGRPRRDGDDRGPRSDRGDRGDRATAGRDRKDRPPRETRERRERPPRPERPAAPVFKKLTPKDTNRRAVLDELAPEQRPIAEQVLRGGIPAVRQAVEAENAKAKEEGRSPLDAAALITLAEGLLPKLKAADWMDRAQAAKEQVNEISVRDLRAVVTGADAVARTEDARLLAAELRDALDRRTNDERDAWLKDITTSLDESRVVRALRLSSRPPDPQVKFPPELLDRLKASTEEAMSPETAPDRWVTLIDAVSSSPIRRNVEPKGLPAEPGDELLSAAKAAAGRIPALAKQLGVTMPPPPPVRKPPPPKPAPKRPPAAPEAKEPEAKEPQATADASADTPAAAVEAKSPEPKAEPKPEVEAATPAAE